MTKQKFGFTLAEVLIVIGIIGVVAALTLPNLNHATGDKETVTKLKKVYSTLVEANDRAVAIYGPVSTWGSSSECDSEPSYCYTQRISEFLKYSKLCANVGDKDNREDCVPNGAHDALSSDTFIILTDGTIIGIESAGFECQGVMNDFFTDICIDPIKIDIDGYKKGKNEDANDTFSFMLSDSLGVLPREYDNWQQACSDSMDMCAKWVIDFGNLDYLKMDRDTRKCKDNPSIILDGVTNTSCH